MALLSDHALENNLGMIRLAKVYGLCEKAKNCKTDEFTRRGIFARISVDWE